MYGFSSGAGILDLIDHVTWGTAKDPMYIKAGALKITPSATASSSMVSPIPIPTVSFSAGPEH